VSKEGFGKWSGFGKTNATWWRFAELLVHIQSREEDERMDINGCPRI